jgi:hypothetical protein
MVAAPEAFEEAPEHLAAVLERICLGEKQFQLGAAHNHK